MIHVALGALADYAADTGLGKLTLVGVFDQINAPHTDGPIALPEATLAFIATASIVDGTDHLAVLTLEDADGKVLGQFELALLFTARGPGYPTKAQTTVNLRGFMVPKLGDYLFRMRVKGVSVAEVPFIVVGNGPKGDVAASDAV